MLFEEISNAKDATGLTYDVIQGLPYLDAVIHETLRRHPIISMLERPCVKDYKVPNPDIVLKKGDLVKFGQESTGESLQRTMWCFGVLIE